MSFFFPVTARAILIAALFASLPLAVNLTFSMEGKRRSTVLRHPIPIRQNVRGSVFCWIIIPEYCELSQDRCVLE